MTVQVYYRKWRPQRFADLVGQDHVSATLRRAIQQDRVAHSYLLCGPRGTGKTSTARVLAKAVNCPESSEGDPCTRCARCRAIQESRFMDLIELDAASNRGIDEIRNIRDRVNLAPVEGGRKVYIIDEAHMLTEHASNAFLKTLEEPPGHAIFILCTTEPHKILPTIISRCQRFDFRRLSSRDILERLRSICVEEGATVDDAALATLAHASSGSLRDAENLLEQIVVAFGGQIGVDQVRELLGEAQGERAIELVGYLAAGNATAALGAINRAAWDGEDLRQLHREGLQLLRGIMMIQAGAGESVDVAPERLRALEEMAAGTSSARVVRCLKLFGEANLRQDASLTLPLELAAVEACLEPPPQAESPAQAPASRSAPSRPRPTPTAAAAPAAQATGNSGAGDVRRTAPPAAPSPPARPAPAAPPDRPAADERDAGGDLPMRDRWSDLVKALSRYKGRRFNIGALLRDCREQEILGDTLVLTFAHKSHMERMEEELDDPQGRRRVEEALIGSFGSSYQLKLILAGDDGSGGVPVTAQSSLVRAALSMGARIVEEREQ
ncbi:MAG: DNA polymerase III subunit gamma/tau [Dehalococcoidia bacterium]|nr:DNA polymerase III subunit gamma/tau [Dehalococcoidia bacterium]